MSRDPGSPRRVLVVGDVHGCLAELEDLLGEAGWREQDRLVFVGDLVAKGPDSVGVVRLARELGAEAVRGNHDERCLDWWRARREGRPEPELGDSHRRVVAALAPEDWAWLAGRPLWLELPEHGAFVIHAGLLPGLPLEAQSPFDLMNLRSIREDGSGSKRLGDGEPWALLWPGPELVVFGHDAVTGLQRHPHAVGLDTGCVYGGRLTGIWLPEQVLVSVPARAAYAPTGR
jgi:hypothetical protein